MTLIDAADEAASERQEMVESSVGQRMPLEAPPLGALLALQKQAVSGNLALVVAHEVNNMLSVIMASTELAGRVIERAQDPRRDLERVEEAAVRAAEVLGDLLRFMGQRSQEAEEFEPSVALSSLGRLLERCARRGVNLRMRLEPTRSIQALRAGFEAAVLGLVDNAREALAGSGEILLESEERLLTDEEARSLGLTPGVYASVRVTDDGAGMDAELVQRASEPYYSTKLRSSGGGLGLTAARAFARSAGGELRLVSSSGQGTTAELLLPLTFGGNPPR